MNELLQAALQYRGHGYSVIPTQPNKKPYIPWSPYQNQKAEPSAIEQWWKEWPEANIGIVTGKISGLVVVDLDKPEAHEKLEELLPESLVTPVATTPRGGRHYYFRHPGNGIISNATGLIDGLDVRGDGGYAIAPPSKGSNDAGYAWLPGLSLLDTPMAEMPKELLSLCRDWIKQIKRGSLKLSKNLAELSNWWTEGHRDETLFHIAIALLAGNMPESEAEAVLNQLARSCTPPYPPLEINNKIKSALKHISNKDRNIAAEVRTWVLEAPGTFSTGQLDRELTLNTRDLCQIRAVTLNTLCKESLIEKAGDRRGYYKRVDSESREVGYMTTTQKELELRWPFMLERYFRAMPRNIIVIAGEPDAGKTAFMLNFAKLNMNQYEIHYFLSEMGGAELRDRLLKFDVPLESWKFKAWERGTDFHDVIRPDAINIIDFLEIYDEFYKVGGLIKQVYDRLDNGIAVIALQKNKGRDEGLGGGRSLEKARLYLAMESGKLKIVKCKNWTDSQFNPNRLQCEFKLVKGCQFIETTEWRQGGSA